MTETNPEATDNQVLAVLETMLNKVGTLNPRAGAFEILDSRLTEWQAQGDARGETQVATSDSMETLVNDIKSDLVHHLNPINSHRDEVHDLIKKYSFKRNDPNKNPHPGNLEETYNWGIENLTALEQDLTDLRDSLEPDIGPDGGSPSVIMYSLDPGRQGLDMHGSGMFGSAAAPIDPTTTTL